MFPNLNGKASFEHIYNNDGWQSVDQAYQNLPVSTVQILHPERYPVDMPTPVDIPDLLPLLGNDCRELDHGVLGEWYTFLIHAHGLDPMARINSVQAQTAAEGWGGDAYTIYYNDESHETVMVLKSVWDTPEEASQFSGTFRQYATAHLGSPREDVSGLL